MAVDTLINGNRPSFVSLQVSLGDKDQPRGVFKSLNYGVQQEPGEIYSKSRSELVGTTPGLTKCTGSFEMLVTELNDFLSDLTDSGQLAATSVIFDITASYSSNEIDTQTDRIIGCRITSLGSANQGTEATTKTVSFLFITLVANGIVVGGDTTAANARTSNTAQPVVTDFWYGPVYEDDKGDWVCPGFVGNTYSKEPWDSLTISVPFSGTEQPQTPGICEVEVTKLRDVDKSKKAAGTDGARITIHGIEPATGEVEITIWTPQQYRMLMDLWPVLFPGPQKFTTTKTVPVNAGGGLTTNPDGSVSTKRFEFNGTITESGATEGQAITIPQTKQTKRVSTTQVKSVIRPFDVQHPKLKMLGINSVVFVAGSGPDPGPAPFSRVFKMRWVELLLPGSVNATVTPPAAKGNTLDPVGYQTPGSNPAHSNLVG